MKDLISIIVPIYNKEKYIDDIISTVKMQTYKNWEIIFIDDASTDTSVKQIESKLSDKIKLCKFKHNKGVSQARNEGIALAQGEYIAFLDADDLWRKDKLQKQIEFMKEKKVAFSFTSYQYEKNGKLGKIVNVPEKLTYVQALKNTVIFTSTVMLNVEIIGKKIMMMPSAKFGEDSITWWNILKNGNVAYGINENLVTYRRSEKSLSSNKIFTTRCTWNSYRKYQKFGIIKSLYYFLFYIFNAIKRRI